MEELDVLRIAYVLQGKIVYMTDSCMLTNTRGVWVRRDYIEKVLGELVEIGTIIATKWSAGNRPDITMRKITDLCKFDGIAYAKVERFRLEELKWIDSL